MTDDVTTEGLGADSQDVGKLTTGLADLKRKEIAATEGAYAQTSGRMEEDRSRMLKAYEDQGIKPNEFQAWNEEEQRAKFQTDPIQAFGSLGSLFGIIASSFTSAPFENAMLASSAAINAVRERNDKEYDRAFKAWEDNTKVALDRHKIQHEQYESAMKLMETDAKLGQEKMRMLAARFGDKKTLYLLENGMDKEVLDLQASRERLAQAMEEGRSRRLVEGVKLHDLLADPAYKNSQDGTPERREAIEKWQERWDTNVRREAEAERQHQAQEKEKSAKQKLDEAKLKPEQRWAKKWLEEHPDASADDFAKALKEAMPSLMPEKTGVMTPGRQEAKAIMQRAQKLMEEDDTLSPDDAFAQAKRSIKMETATPTGNRLDDLTGKINRVKYMTETITNVEELLKKHKAITGLGGKVMRPAETIGNIVGVNSTDYRQFERWVNELKEWAPQVLMDRSGRPLSAEAAQINSTIAGLSVGDTVQSTVRAYRELKKLLAEMQGDLELRRYGEPESPRDSTEKGKPAPKSKSPWMNDPVVGQ